MQKYNKYLMLSLLCWVLFFLLSFPASNASSLKQATQIILAVIYFSLPVLAIVFTVKCKKAKHKKEKAVLVPDENVLHGRKLYKNIFHGAFKNDMKIISVVYFLIVIPILIYIYTLGDKLASIIMTCSMIFVYFTTFLSIYFIGKKFLFPYKETLLNGESYVLFVTRSTIMGRINDPVFHVVHNCKEHTESSRVMWARHRAHSVLDLLDDALYAATHDLIRWFSGHKFSNFIRIDIKSNQGEKLQCVYKFWMNRFIITNKLENLDGCFEKVYTPTRKRKKNKEKS